MWFLKTSVSDNSYIIYLLYEIKFSKWL